MNHPLLHLIVLFGLALPSAGKDLLVSNEDELEEAIESAKPGDTVIMRDGVWRDQTIYFNGQGTAEKPITLRAQTPGKVMLSGESRIGIGGKHLVVSGLLFRDGYVEDHVIAFRSHGTRLAEHCRVTNCAIVGYNPPDKDRGNKWVSFYGRHNRLDHCHIEGKDSRGATVVVWLDGKGGPNHHQIDHNYFGPRPDFGNNEAETIRVGDSKTSMSVSKTVVEDNLFEACDGEIEVISSKSCENTFRRNTFLKCAGTLTLRHGNRCVVDSNYFLASGKAQTGGIRVIGEGHRITNNYIDAAQGRTGGVISLHCGRPNSPLNGYFQVKDTLIAFNTVVNSNGPGIITDYGFGTKSRKLLPEGVLIANNILTTGVKDNPLVVGRDVPGITWRGNIGFGGGAGDQRGGKIEHVDPRLEKDENGLWRPTAQSPAIAAAQGHFPEVRWDIDGHERGTRKDIGADQSSQAKPNHLPLTRDDVGIDWQLENEADEAESLGSPIDN